MSAAPKHTAYSRKAFLAKVPTTDRALAARLCELLEASFPVADIMLYGGGAMPIVVRDMEWIAGFAMRKAHPVAYCCSPAVREAMGGELAPYMSGKSCVAVKPRKGEPIEVVLEIVGRAFREASRHGGVISKTDARRRERMRREVAAEGAAASKKSGARRPAARKTAKQAATGMATKKAATKKAATKKTAKRKTAPTTKPGAGRSLARSATRKPGRA